MARALVNRLGVGQPVLENVYKTRLKRDLISQGYQVVDTSLNSSNYFHFTDLDVEPARALVNRAGRAIINYANDISVDDGRAIINRYSGSLPGVEPARALANRQGGGITVSPGMTQGNGQLPVVQQRSVASRLASGPVPGTGGGVVDQRAVVSRSNSNRMAGVEPGRVLVNRYGQLIPAPGPGGVNDARSLVSRSNTSRLSGIPSTNPGGANDGRALVNRSNSSRIGGIEPGRVLVNRMAGGSLPPQMNNGIDDFRSVNSRANTSNSNRMANEDGYEFGDQRAVVSRVGASASQSNLVKIRLTAGKNVIKFAADGPCMRVNQPVDFEVLDSQGNPLYTEITNYKDRLGFYYAIIYVYDITPPGIGSVCFVGHASHDPNYNPLPMTNRENLAWIGLVDIDPYKRNNKDIIFEQSPTVEVSQVLVPYQFNLGTYALASRLTSQSLYGLTLLRSDNVGFDFADNSTIDILDQASKDNTYNYFGESITTSTIETNIRRYDSDITNGFIFSEYSRYNTILVDSQGRFTKDMEGSIFSFENTNGGLSYTSSYGFTPPYTSSTITPATDIVSQLDAYKAKIVYVLNSKYALLDTPPSVDVYDSRNSINTIRYNHTFKKVSNLSGSFVYPTSSLNVITSQNLSSSFIQFTITDFEPIVGDVYRIKTFVKEAGSNTEFKQLNDHVVIPPEYLTDSDKPNQAAYAKNKSDSFVYGEFTDATIANEYWRGFGIEADKKLYQYTFNPISSYPLANAVVLTSKNTLKKGIASRYYQTYIPNQPFSLSFYCTLDPGCELEVYMGSTPLKDSVIGIQGPKAFNETRNMDASILKAYNKFGKMIGKISNISGSSTKTYDNIVFDFFADADGYGRPVFFLNTDSVVDKNAYISSISITPLDLVGYTPTILQFAAPVPDSLWILQDDDASLTQSIDLKVEYFNYEGKQSEFTTFIPNVQMNLITEVPGFCSAEASRFNDHCPLYYEVTSNGTSNTTVGTNVTKDPQLYNETYNIESPINLYFWPTYSLNDYNGFYWNVINFGVGTSYNTESLAWHTSSNTINTLWRRFDPIMPVYDQAMPGTSPFPAMYSASAAGVYSIGDDSQLFWKSNGTLISPIDIAQALPTYSSSFYVQQDTTRINEWNTYLKKTRLYYPTTSEGYNYGFNENGGIYNVRFNLKRWPQYQRSGPSLTVNGISGFIDDGAYPFIYPPSSEQVLDWQFTAGITTRYAPVNGAKLMIYIHDVATPLVTGSKWQKGTPGFYPPDNNIVTIGNGYSTTPTLRYYDSGSGAFIDTYDIILVQYGDRAQLTFDASGIELTLDDANSGYYNLRHVSADTPANAPLWGGMIADIEWCKIGVTTDPNFIKPANFRDTFIQRPKKGTWEGGTAIID